MKMTIKYKFNPVKTAFYSRVALILLQIAVTSIGNKYDTSSAYQGILSRTSAFLNTTAKLLDQIKKNEKLFDKYIIKLLDGFGNWDSVYFLHISKYGYEYEQFMAFFPFFPSCISVLAHLIQTLTYNAFGELATLYLAAMMINIISFIIATLFFHKLTNQVTGNSKFADVTALLFCINPANVFHSASYSESLFSCTQITAMYLLEYETNAKKYLYAGLLFALGTVTRSNGLISAGFLFYSLLLDQIRGFFHLQNRGITDRYQLLNIAKKFVMFILGLLAMLTVFVVFQSYGYILYCSKYEKTLMHQNHWCFETLPMSYTYIQRFYWNVGPFRYYELRQIPNFGLASPVICLGFSLIWAYFTTRGIMKRLTQYVFQGQIPTKRISKCDLQDIMCSPILLPYVCHLLFMLLVGIVNVHIQVLTRLLFSSSPVLYWYTASHIFSNCDKLKVWSIPYFILVYFLLYSLIGVLIHCNFYPWT